MSTSRRPCPNEHLSLAQSPHAEGGVRRVSPWRNGLEVVCALLLCLAFSAGLPTHVAGPSVSAPVSDSKSVGVAGLVGSLVGITSNDTASPNPGDAGLRIAFTSWATGCDVTCATYAWVWGDGTGGSSLQHDNHTYAHSATYIVDWWANGSITGGVEDSFPLVINPPLGVSVTGSLTQADVNESVNFTATPSGGTQPWKASWVLGDGVRSSSLSLDHAFASPGNYSNQVWVNDSANGSVHRWWNVTVHPPLMVTLGASRTTLEATQPETLEANVSGGTSPWTAAWNLGDGSRASTANVTHAYGAAGTYQVHLWVNDSAQTSIERTVNISVLPLLSATASASSTATDVGQSVTFTGTESGGLGPYNYTWAFGNSTRYYEENVTLSFDTQGTYVATLWVNDSGNASSFDTQTVNVDTRPQVTAQAARYDIDAGEPAQFTAQVDGGTAPYNYSWSFGDGTGAFVANPSHTYLEPGTYTAHLWMNDSAGVGVTWSHTMTIASPLSLHELPTSAVSDAGRAVTFSVTGAGGTGPFNVTWLFGDGSGPVLGSLTGSTLHAYSSTGTFAVRVYLNDSVGGSVDAISYVSVHPDPVTSPSASTVTTFVGQSISFTGAFTGGTSPWTFAWVFGDGGVSSSQNASHSYLSQGIFTVRFWVNDSVGSTSEGNLSLTVSAVPNGSGSSAGGLSVLDWGVIGLIILLLVLLLVYFVVGRRRSGSSGAASVGVLPPGGDSPPDTGAIEFSTEEGALPPWPSIPLTVLEADSPAATYRMAASSALGDDHLLLFTVEDPETIRKDYGLPGVNIWRVSRIEGEGNISPLDVDRMGHLCEAHFGKGSGRGVVITATEMLVNSAGLRNAGRLLQVLREVAEAHHGAVIVFLNPSNFTLPERRALEEGARRIHIVSASASKPPASK